MTLNLWGVPANPRWIQRLTEEGDTARLEQVLQKRGRWNGQSVRFAEQQLAADRQRVAIPLNLAPKGLIILVNFTDMSWTKADHAEMDSMINGQNYSRSYSYYDNYSGQQVSISASGSARKYFHDSSFGQYNPVFTVIGPVTVSHNYAYYGQNDTNGDDKRAEEMVVEACRLADQQGVDFTQFDNNGDGDVDFVYIFYAGEQESDGSDENTIWPHSYTLDDYYYQSHQAVRIDGKRLNKYACSGEIEAASNKHEGIGTFCHEFSHVLGLPDLYETTYSSQHKTMGYWDILDAGPYNNGGNTPPLYSAYEQFFMGWLTPVVVVDSGTYSLPPLTRQQQAYLICAGGSHNLVGIDPNPTTFYMLENRQQEGWDAHIPGHGLMLTKVKYNASTWSENTVNNNKNDMGVDLIEADGSAPRYNSSNPDNGNYGKPGDLFPAGATSYSGISGYPIRDISESNGTVTFTVGGSGSSSGGSGSGGGEGSCSNYSWTASKKLNVGDNILEDYTWTLTTTSSGYTGYESNRGAQLGSRNNPILNMSLTTTEVSNCLIASVTVNAAQGSGGDSKLSVYIGGTRIGNEQSLSNTSNDYTFTNTGNVLGALEVRITNTQKAAYLKRISIVQTAAATNIETAEETRKARKIWENGRIVIVRDDVRYDVLGNVIR